MYVCYVRDLVMYVVCARYEITLRMNVMFCMYVYVCINVMYVCRLCMYVMYVVCVMHVCMYGVLAR